MKLELCVLSKQPEGELVCRNSHCPTHSCHLTVTNLPLSVFGRTPCWPFRMYFSCETSVMGYSLLRSLMIHHAFISPVTARPVFLCWGAKLLFYRCEVQLNVRFDRWHLWILLLLRQPKRNQTRRGWTAVHLNIEKIHRCHRWIITLFL